MALDTDQLALLQQAVITGQDIKSTGLRQTAEVKRVFAELENEYNNAPEGTMVEIVADIDFGKYDAFEANNERFYGKLY
jgi:hypothetical protein